MERDQESPRSIARSATDNLTAAMQIAGFIVEACLPDPLMDPWRRVRDGIGSFVSVWVEPEASALAAQSHRDLMYREKGKK